MPKFLKNRRNLLFGGLPRQLRSSKRKYNTSRSTIPTHQNENCWEFAGFLEELLATAGPEKEVHIITDNLSAHKTKSVAAFLVANPRVRIHYTPTYSSWLNQVEIWFSKLQRDIISHGIFTSQDDLRREIMRYIRHDNKSAVPFKWTYKNTSSRIR